MIFLHRDHVGSGHRDGGFCPTICEANNWRSASGLIPPSPTVAVLLEADAVDANPITAATAAATLALAAGVAEGATREDCWCGRCCWCCASKLVDEEEKDALFSGVVVINCCWRRRLSRSAACCCCCCRWWCCWRSCCCCCWAASAAASMLATKLDALAVAAAGVGGANGCGENRCCCTLGIVCEALFALTAACYNQRGLWLARKEFISSEKSPKCPPPLPKYFFNRS